MQHQQLLQPRSRSFPQQTSLFWYLPPSQPLTRLQSFPLQCLSLTTSSSYPPPPLPPSPPQLQSHKPAFSKYAAAVVEHDVTGTFLAEATEEELNDMFKEMQVSLAHKVELRAAVAGWKANPQQVSACPSALILHPFTLLFPPPQALQAIERERATEQLRQVDAPILAPNPPPPLPPLPPQ